MTGRDFLFRQCDSKLTDEDLNDEGNAFATAYYKNGPFYEDYASVFPEELPTIYHVEDSWENFDKVCVVFDRRYEQWKAKRPSR